MGILLDSDVLIDWERTGTAPVTRIAGREHELVFLSVVSASELLHGAHRASTPQLRTRRLAFTEAVLASLPILDIDIAVARAHAQVWCELRVRGEMIGAHDAWLAATCLAHGLILATGNVREFARVPGLTVERWR